MSFLKRVLQREKAPTERGNVASSLMEEIDRIVAKKVSLFESSGERSFSYDASEPSSRNDFSYDRPKGGGSREFSADAYEGEWLHLPSAEGEHYDFSNYSRLSAKGEEDLPGYQHRLYSAQTKRRERNTMLGPKRSADFLAGGDPHSEGERLRAARANSSVSREAYHHERHYSAEANNMDDFYEESKPKPTQSREELTGGYSQKRYHGRTNKYASEPVYAEDYEGEEFLLPFDRREIQPRIKNERQLTAVLKDALRPVIERWVEDNLETVVTEALSKYRVGSSQTSSSKKRSTDF